MMGHIIAVSTIMLLLSVSKHVAETPPFHQMPFGSHSAAVDIGEATADNMPSPELFAKDHLIPKKPLVFRGVTKQWPAFTDWTDHYLKDNYGRIEVRIDKTKETFLDMPAQGDVCLARDTLAHFIDTYSEEGVNKFVESELPTPLYKYVKIPSSLGCGDLSKSFIEIDVWMSSGEVTSMLRKDSFNKISCVVNGTTEWKIVDPTYDSYMYEIWRGDTHEKSNTAYSMVNPKKVNMVKFRKVAEIRTVSTASLNAGDCLYVPAGHWHTTNFKGDKNMAVTFVLKTINGMDELKLGDCATKPNDLPLEQVDPDWKYKGSGRMSMGNSPISHYLDIMKSTFFGRISKILKKENIQLSLAFLHQYLPYRGFHMNDRVEVLFEKLVSLTEREHYTEDMVESLTRDQLREFANEYIQPAIPANSYTGEYRYFSPGKISKFFKSVSEEGRGILRVGTFVEQYVSIGGHVGIAKSMWKVIAGKQTEVVFNEVRDEIDEAIGNFHNHWLPREELSTVDDDFSEPEEVLESTSDDASDESSKHVEKDEL